jgi:phosphoribosylformylglycinamidine synthase
MVFLMKARVYVSLKPTVLDPQGQTIRRALAGLGYSSIAEVRQGKYFDIAFDSAADPDKAAAELDQIAREVLSNPVIEEYRIDILQ